MRTLPTDSEQPPVMSRAFIDRAVRFEASDDPDTATAQTVEMMARLIERSAQDPLLWAAAETALRQYARGGPMWAIRGIDPFQSSDPSVVTRARCEAAWWYARHQLKFVHHATQIDVWLNERDHLQLLIEPSVLLRFPFRMQGDCAIYTMLVSAMLEILGVPFEIVTAAVNRRQPEIFSHVWLQAILPDGRRFPLDASHGVYPGWQVPDEDIYRQQVWDSAGNATSGDVRSAYTGLHGYRVRGLGDDVVIGDSGGTITPPVDPTLSDWQALAASASAGGADTSTPQFTSVNGTQGIVAPPQSNAAAWNAFANVLKSTMTLAEIQTIQPGTVVSANGAILRQATGLPVPVGGSLSTSLAAINPTYLWVGGLAVVGLIVVKSLSK